MAEPRDLIWKRCLNHPTREAAARCPVCRNYFCRECVTEHAERTLCAVCLARLARSDAHGGLGLGTLVGASARVLAGLTLAWFFFYSVGQVLLMIPDTFHPTTGRPAAGGEAGGRR